MIAVGGMDVAVWSRAARGVDATSSNRRCCHDSIQMLRSRRLQKQYVVLHLVCVLLSAQVFLRNGSQVSTPMSTLLSEKSIVCRERGHDLMISVSSSEKPSESIRSASSRTRMSRVSRVKVGVFRMWSMRRPGVAMMTSGRVRRAAS